MQNIQIGTKIPQSIMFVQLCTLEGLCFFIIIVYLLPIIYYLLSHLVKKLVLLRILKEITRWYTCIR